MHFIPSKIVERAKSRVPYAVTSRIDKLTLRAHALGKSKWARRRRQARVRDVLPVMTAVPLLRVIGLDLLAADTRRLRRRHGRRFRQEAVIGIPARRVGYTLHALDTRRWKS